MDTLLEGFEDDYNYEPGLPASFADRLKLHQGRVLTRSTDCQSFLYEKLPGVFSLPPSVYHTDFYRHVDSLVLGEESKPFVACWPRSAGKSTAGMGAVVFSAATKRTRYVYVVSEHMPNARDRLRSLQLMFKEASFRQSFPDVALPALNSAGQPIAWNSKILFNKAGQIFQASSLKSSNRGAQQGSVETVDPDMPDEVKRLIELQVVRPDLLILDDIDSKLDGERATQRKEEVISADIMAMGSSAYPLRTLILQNRIIENGVVGRIYQREDGCIAPDAIFSGPWPALAEMKTRPVMRQRESTGTLDLQEHQISDYILRLNGAADTEDLPESIIVEYPSHDIVEGYPSWPKGMGLDKCQSLVDRMGLGEFKAEMLHITTNREGALLSDKDFRQAPADFDPSIVENKIVVVDPGGGATETGIIVLGNTTGTIEYDGTPTRCELWYVLEDLTVTSKVAWEPIAVMAASRHHCDVLVEYNYGGNNLVRSAETARDSLRDRSAMPGPLPEIHSVTAQESKPDRAIPFAAVYKEGRVFHVGDMSKLEREWTSTQIKKGVESPNRMDAAVHGFDYLQRQTGRYGLWGRG